MPYADATVQGEYQRRWMAARRQEWLAGKVCHGCGADGPLEMHHLNPAERITHAIWSWAEPRRLAELAKCVPLCRPCHEAVHARLRRIAALERNPHGTRNRYRLGCRCDPCRHAHRVYNAAHPPKVKATA